MNIDEQISHCFTPSFIKSKISVLSEKEHLNRGNLCLRNFYVKNLGTYFLYAYAFTRVTWVGINFPSFEGSWLLELLVYFSYEFKKNNLLVMSAMKNWLFESVSIRC